MQVGGIENFVYNTKQSIRKNDSIKCESFQVGKETPQTDKVLGIGFLDSPSENISYGMSAKYAESSSADSPVIKVTITKIGSKEVHYVNINDINVANATEIEMFALCCYADDIGQGTGDKFGSWQTLNYYRRNASDNGDFTLSNSYNLGMSLRQNWIKMVEEMKKIYIESGYYRQSLDGDKLLGLFNRIIA